MPKPHHKLEPAVALAGLLAVASCALAAGMALSDLSRSQPPPLVVSDTALARDAAVAADARTWAASAPAPARSALAPDEWTSDAPAFPAKLARAKLVAPAPPAPPPPPPQLTPSQAAVAAASPAAKPATAPQSLALAQPAADESKKMCRVQSAPVDPAKAASLRLKLRYAPEIGRRTLDIAPTSPPQEQDQEQRIRLSALLAEALQP